jgi:ATP-dependent Clp endopeptidase proteolytic subunit ClpP
VGKCNRQLILARALIYQQKTKVFRVMKTIKKMKISALSDAINRASAGPYTSPLEAKNSISPKGELLLYGIIGDWWDSMDALSIVSQLNQLPGDVITVRIQSPGGNVTEGLAMYNQLKQSPKRVDVYIDGVAASMAAGVAMAGDNVYIPSNAIMMIHKPHIGDVSGNENDLRDMADALAQLEKSYAQILADKTGKTREEISAFIADGKDHFFIGSEAVDFGLADQLIENVKLDAKASAKFSAVSLPEKAMASLFTVVKPTAAPAAINQEEVDMLFKVKAKAGGWHLIPAINAALNGTYTKIEDAIAALGGKVTIANLKEILAGEAVADDAALNALAAAFGINQTQQTPPATPATPATTNPTDAVALERDRVREIHAIAAQAKVKDDVRDQWVFSGITTAEARAKALETVAARDAQSAPTSYLRTGGSVSREGMRAAMTNAMIHRIDPSVALTDQGRDFRGMNIVAMISAALEADGQSVRGKTASDIVAMAMHHTSDFPLILQDVANRTLRAAYTQAPRTFMPIATQTTASDFKTKHSLQIGGGSDLALVNENGEFKSGTVTEGGESYKLSTYGRIFAFSRQMLINDDLDALNRFMSTIGNLAGRKENSIIWSLVKANPTLSDTVAVYSTDAKRLNQWGGANLDETSLSAGRKAMRQLKGLEGEPISVSPKFLVVNSERETAAQKILAQVQPNATSGVNPFSNSMQLIVEPLLDGVANNPWYLFSDPKAVPCLEYCYLEGEAGPYTETKWGFEVDGVALKVRHDFGAGFVDFRGSGKCTGA